MRHVLLATTLAAVGSLAVAAPASAALPSSGAWPVCAAPADRHCVESAVVRDGDGGASDASATLEVRSDEDQTVSWTAVGDDPPAGRYELVLRLGSYLPYYVDATAAGFRATYRADNDGDVTLTITGSPVTTWRGDLCAGQGYWCVTGFADPAKSGTRFAGEFWAVDHWSGGADPETLLEYIGSDAAYSSIGSEAADGHWELLGFGNPDFGPDRRPLRSTLSTAIPERYFTDRGTTGADAVAAGLDVVAVRWEWGAGEVEAPVPATAEALPGGVAIDVPDLVHGYYAVRVYPRPSTFQPGSGVPGVPTAVTVTGAHDRTTVSWAPPESTGGLPITRYVARIYGAAAGGPAYDECWTGADGTTCDLDATRPTATSYVHVSAVTAYGEGMPATALPVAGRRVAGGVRNLVVVARSGQATVTWAPPADPGTSPITAYRVFRIDDSRNECVTGPATRTCTIRGLTTGRTYPFSVYAVTADGWGIITGLSTTVAGPPGTPRAVSARPTGAKIRAAWAPPASDYGSRVTRYHATVWTAAKGGSPVASCTAPASRRTCTTRAIAGKRAYWIAITAVNGVGVSAPSTRVRVTVR
ncbi:fibronectin type III domain-containing protein [Spirilliplanes yamanashiensis]|uniref:fibronectin type III domain-containing protein n=1 Tax=Spirilliplanes yamanashiensis TaxID=42233 RepID=UPI00194E72C4|nr:fibronectin type III domain-containing protein [Spirilliplanes yamanashiensis]MDP9815490.1 hypothetical protein [Spirilliplanes yamanashiensis]